MNDDAKDLVSANVLLRPVSGKPIDGYTAITADNIHEYAPPAHAATVLPDFFSEQAFEVGPVVGISFSITAPLSHFETFFAARLQRNDQGVAQVLHADGSIGYDLPLEQLGDSVRGQILAIALEEPTAFGPANFGI